jgi:predicted permease
MIINAIAVLLPIFFVMGLGYLAGRRKKFDADQIRGLNVLVLDYALPAMLFVSTVSTTRSQLLAQADFLIALLIAFIGLFAVVYIVSTRRLHHSTGEAALQANLVSFPSLGFIGPPIFQGLFGPTSVESIAIAAVAGSVTMIPLTLVLLEIHHQQVAGVSGSLGGALRQGLIGTLKKPMVWAPLVGLVFVLADVDMPPVIDSMLNLIGSTTSGVSIFLAGLIISTYSIKVTREVAANTALKMVGQPLLMAALVVVLAIPNPLATEAILICAIPSAVFAPLLAPLYKAYENESAATLVATSLTMIVTLPIFIVATGA